MNIFQIQTRVKLRIIMNINPLNDSVVHDVENKENVHQPQIAQDDLLKTSVGTLTIEDKISVGKDKEILNLRLAKRSPFQALNMESLQNAKKAIYNDQVALPRSVTKLSIDKEGCTIPSSKSTKATPVANLSTAADHGLNSLNDKPQQTSLDIVAQVFSEDCTQLCPQEYVSLQGIDRVENQSQNSASSSVVKSSHRVDENEQIKEAECKWPAISDQNRESVHATVLDSYDDKSISITDANICMVQDVKQLAEGLNADHIGETINNKRGSMEVIEHLDLDNIGQKDVEEAKNKIPIQLQMEEEIELANNQNTDIQTIFPSDHQSMQQENEAQRPQSHPPSRKQHPKITPFETEDPVQHSNSPPSHQMEEEFSEASSSIKQSQADVPDVNEKAIETASQKTLATNPGLINLRTMSKSQVMENLRQLIEKNNSLVEQTPSQSTPQKKDGLSIHTADFNRREGVTPTLDSHLYNSEATKSMSFASELQASIQQSLKAFHQTIQTSRFAATNKSELSPRQNEHSPDRLSISSLHDDDDDQLHLNEFSVSNILQELQYEEKENKPASIEMLLEEKLESEFKVRSLKKCQLTVIKKILNRESCLYRHPNAEARDVVYQLPALLTKGVVLYICTSIAQMAAQIQSLPHSLYGACYNGLSSKQDNLEILDLVKTGQVRMLYCTIDKVTEVLDSSLTNIDYIVYDELLRGDDWPAHHRAQIETLLAPLSDHPKLVLLPPASTLLALQVAETFGIQTSSLHPSEAVLSGLPNVTISRDEDPTKALLTLLKNKGYGAKQSTVIYTDTKRTAEELATFLGHNGLKSQLVLYGRTELQKLELSNSYGKIPEMVYVTISGVDLGLDKGVLTSTIHYNMPRSPAIFAQEALYLGKKGRCHVFLTEEDYFRGRNAVFGELVEKEQVEQFIRQLLKTLRASTGEIRATKDQASSLLNKRKRDGTSKKSTASTDFNPFVSKTLTLAQNEQKDKKLVSELANELLTVKTTELCRQISLRKDICHQVFEQIACDSEWLEYFGTSPLLCNVRFLYTLNPKKVQSKMAESPAAKVLSARNKRSSGMMRIVVPDLAREAHLSPSEFIKELKT